MNPIVRLHARAAAVAALAILGASAAVAVHAAAGPYRVPAPVPRTLPNGLRVMVFQDARIPVVQIQLRVPAGLDAEPPGENGIANLTAQLLTRGTNTRDANGFALDLGQHGGTMTGAAGREFATVSATFLTSDLETGLELLSDAVVNPVFPEIELGRAISRTGRGLLQLRQNPVATVEEQIWPLAMPGRAAANPPSGSLETLAQLNRDRLRSFHRERYRPRGSVLAIAGDVTPERAFAAAAEWLGRWPDRGEPAPPPPPPPRPAAAGTRIRILDHPGSAVCAVGVGMVVPGRTAPDEVTRLVAVRVQDWGLSARLLRVGGIGRDARATLGMLGDAGIWILQGTAPADSAGALARRLRSDLRRFLVSGPAAKDAAAASRAIASGFPLAFETAGALMGQWLLADRHGLGPDYFDGFRSRVAALTPADLLAAAKRGAEAERLVIVAAGPASRLEPLLKPFGTVEVVRSADPTAPREPAPPPVAPATTVERAAGRKIIEGAIAAHGGLERLKGVTTSRVDASVVLFVEGSPFAGTLSQTRREPFKMVYFTRLEGFESRQVLNGNRAWTVVSSSDSVLESDSLEVAALRTGFAFDLPHLLVAAADRATIPARRGKARIGERDADAVEVVMPTGERRTLYFDSSTRLLLAVDHRERGPGGFVEARRTYRDYRTVAGIQWPYEEERSVGGQPLMKMSVTALEINQPVGEIDFRPPARKPPVNR